MDSFSRNHRQISRRKPLPDNRIPFEIFVASGGSLVEDFCQLWWIPPQFKVPFICQHRKHHPDQLAGRPKNSHLVCEPFFFLRQYGRKTWLSMITMVVMSHMTPPVSSEDFRQHSFVGLWMPVEESGSGSVLCRGAGFGNFFAICPSYHL